MENWPWGQLLVMVYWPPYGKMTPSPIWYFNPHEKGTLGSFFHGKGVRIPWKFGTSNFWISRGEGCVWFIFVMLIKIIMQDFIKIYWEIKSGPHFEYSQTCIQRSPLGQTKNGLIREVTFKYRLDIHKINYEGTFRRWPFNWGDLWKEVTTKAGLTVYRCYLTSVGMYIFF